MKKNKATLSLALAVSAALLGANTVTASDLAETDQIIVKYKDNQKSVSNMGFNMREIKRTHNNARVMKFDKKLKKKELTQLLAEYNSSPDVEYAEPDRIKTIKFEPNDQFYNLQWHYHEAAGGINLPTAWDSSTGAGVKVAVLDTGYRPHVDLAANIIGGYDMINDTFVSNDGDGRDSDAQDPGDWVTFNQCGGFNSARDSSWHGTHVAGTVAAVSNNSIGVAGVAFNAQVVPVRVLGQCGGYESDISAGMIWASGGSVSGVPTNPNPAKVLNLSLGGPGPCSNTEQAAINTAVANGSVVVIAAGNSNEDVSQHSPGNCDNVISVASTGRSGEKSSFSNFGSLIDIAAPGGNGPDGIASTLNDGATTPANDIYVYNYGTSMAAPHVAGVAALMLSVNPNLTPAEIEQTIKDTARSFPDNSCNTSNCGAGIVDAAAAVAAVNGGNPPPPPPTNEAPTAAFTFSCTDLSCDFNGTGSSDSDGSIISYSWSFGASGATASNTFAADGTYNVTLTVTDDDGATDTATQSVSVTDSSEPPPADDITLSGTRANRNRTVNLTWSGSSANNVDIYRNGSLRTTTANDGAYSDRVNRRRSYTYQVCSAGTNVCSNNITL